MGSVLLVRIRTQRTLSRVRPSSPSGSVDRSGATFERPSRSTASLRLHHSSPPTLQSGMSSEAPIARAMYSAHRRLATCAEKRPSGGVCTMTSMIVATCEPYWCTWPSRAT
eukprot:4290416-Prymnesium_polylepis.1